MTSYLLHQEKLPWQAKRPSLGSMIWPTRFQLRSLVNITGLISQSQSSIFPSPAWVQLQRLVTRRWSFTFNPEYQELHVRSGHPVTKSVRTHNTLTHTQTFFFTRHFLGNDEKVIFWYFKNEVDFLLHCWEVRNSQALLYHGMQSSPSTMVPHRFMATNNGWASSCETKMQTQNHLSRPIRVTWGS